MKTLTLSLIGTKTVPPGSPHGKIVCRIYFDFGTLRLGRSMPSGYVLHGAVMQRALSCGLDRNFQDADSLKEATLSILPS